MGYRAPAFDADLADAVCEALACGMRLPAIIADPKLPSWTTLLAWREANADFAARFRKARIDVLPLMEDECLDIADGVGQPKPSRDPTPGELNAKGRLQIATREWVMEKRDPETYARTTAAAAAARAKTDAEAAVPDREALVAEAGKAALEAWKRMEYAARWAKHDRTIGTATFTEGNCTIPLNRFVTPDGRYLDNKALGRDLYTRVIGERLKRGIGSDPYWPGGGTCDQELLAVICGDPDVKVTLTPGAFTGMLPPEPAPRPCVDEDEEDPP